MLTAFRRVRAQTTDVKQLQDGLDPTLKSILSKEILDGVLIDDVKITGGTALTIQHKLGREPKGWIITGRNANAVVWSSSSSMPSYLLVLNASATVTVSLWVF